MPQRTLLEMVESLVRIMGNPEVNRPPRRQQNFFGEHLVQTQVLDA
jgi:hypothetical protein